MRKKGKEKRRKKKRRSYDYGRRKKQKENLKSNKKRMKEKKKKENRESKRKLIKRNYWKKNRKKKIMKFKFKILIIQISYFKMKSLDYKNSYHKRQLVIIPRKQLILKDLSVGLVMNQTIRNLLKMRKRFQLT